MFQKGKHRTHGSLLILNRFIYFFTVRFSNKFAAKLLLKIPPRFIGLCIATLSCETLVSENERLSQNNAVNNDKLQHMQGVVGFLVTLLQIY